MTSKETDLFISSGLDQTNIVDASWVIEKMQAVVDESIKAKNVDIAITAINQLFQVAKISGLGLAKGLYELKEHWNVFGIDEPFEDYVYQRIGRHRSTIDRYVKVWRMYAKNIVPEEYVQQLMSFNIKDQIPIANAVEGGWQFDDDDWKEMAHAPDTSSIGHIVNKILRRPARATGIRLMLDRYGNIWAYTERYDRKLVGTLEWESEDEIVKKSVKRITSRSGIMEQ